MDPYQKLTERLLLAAPVGGYHSADQLPPLGVAELAAILEHEPTITASIRFDSEAIVRSLRLRNWERTVVQLSIQTHAAIEEAARAYLFCDLISRRAAA